MRLLLSALLLSSVVNVTGVTGQINEKGYVSCDGYISNKNEITFYDTYDGNIYEVDTNLEIGTKVNCIIDTIGTANIYDDAIISITVIE